MFKKEYAYREALFDVANRTHRFNAGAKTKVKSSVQRGILEQFPLLEPALDDLLPKKSQLDLYKLCASPSFILFSHSSVSSSRIFVRLAL